MSKRIEIGGGRVWAQTVYSWIEMPAIYHESMVVLRDFEMDVGIRRLTPAEIERAERGLGPLRAQSVTVRDAAGEVVFQEPADDTDIGTTYTRAQLNERKAGAVAAAFALGWGTVYQADRADAKAIAADAVHMVQKAMLAIYGDDNPLLTPDHVAGAAQFFRELSEALDEHAAKMRGPQ